jgi:hypothetical protein
LHLFDLALWYRTPTVYAALSDLRSSASQRATKSLTSHSRLVKVAHYRQLGQFTIARATPQAKKVTK